MQGVDSLWWLVGAAYYLALCVGVSAIAAGYQRSARLWFIFSLLTSPLAGLIFLLAAVAPSTPSKSKAEPEPEVTAICGKCGAVVSVTSGVGLKRIEGEEWRLICAACSTELSPDDVRPPSTGA